MQTLTIFGQSFDFNNEVELTVKDELGLDIVIETSDCFEHRNNCTEFHHIFNKKEPSVFGLESAFESDIHADGGTKALDKIMSITVTKAIFVHKEHRLFDYKKYSANRF